MKFVLTFTQNDLTLVEIYTVVLHFGLDTCQIKLGLYRSTQSAQEISTAVITCTTLIQYYES